MKAWRLARGCAWRKRRDDACRTPVAGCPACDGFRLHSPAERAQHHPLAGHGFANGAWTDKISPPQGSV